MDILGLQKEDLVEKKWMILPQTSEKYQVLKVSLQNLKKLQVYNIYQYKSYNK